MKELDSFTVEQLKDFIKSDHVQCGDVAALAAIALAAKRAEPEWYVVITSVGVWQTRYKTRSEAESHIKPWHKDYWIKELYTTPQLNSPQGWIKCSDQMPEDDTLCLGVDECGVIWTMHFDDGEFRADTGDVDDLEISHWMPLPAAPEKENG
ncbi:DUF551 domain-containing protein [Yersinia rochesterensis]|uniref:DUF551 domain-containing protein n=1 Tax=Yersinia rochesterensis TaxID=1604335 RepID=UPI0011AA1344|nr:DUF551 domain-containing protein [Yersinia rochesterensis]